MAVKWMLCVTRVARYTQVRTARHQFKLNIQSPRVHLLYAVGTRMPHELGVIDAIILLL